MAAYSLISATKFDPFLTTLEWNNDSAGAPSPFFLLHFHLDRLCSAATQHGWTRARAALSGSLLTSLCQQAVDQCSGACKIRIILSQAGHLSVTATVVEPFTVDPMSLSFFHPDVEDPSLFGSVMTVFLDDMPTPTSLFTVTKTTERASYEGARMRAAIPSSPHPSSDVLLYESHGLLTEASIYNVALHRSGAWVTPATSTGCLPGVLRRWLLEQKRIREDDDGTLTKDSLKEGEWVLLFNGVQGCRLGRITLHPICE